MSYMYDVVDDSIRFNINVLQRDSLKEMIEVRKVSHEGQCSPKGINTAIDAVDE